MTRNNLKSEPLVLGVGRSVGTRVSTQSHFAPEDFKSLKQKIFERDNHTCQCCGFQSQKYQEILHKDMNAGNYETENLSTVCNFCYQVFHLEGVAEMRSGVLVWLPEISQEDLHHIMRAIYVARVTQGPMADAAKIVLDLLMARREQALQRIGTDDPAVLAYALSNFLEDGEYPTRVKKLKGLRLLPLDRRIIKEGDLEFNQFPQILAHWRSKTGPFGAMMPTAWAGMLETAEANLK